MPGSKKAPPRTGRSSSVPNLADPTISRAVQAAASATGAIEREHVGAGGDAHALATTKRHGFLPALAGNAGDVLTLELVNGQLVAVWRAP